MDEGRKGRPLLISLCSVVGRMITSPLKGWTEFVALGTGRATNGARRNLRQAGQNDRSAWQDSCERQVVATGCRSCEVNKQAGYNE